jgi:membrane protease YdiL (CAAX protease family)
MHSSNSGIGMLPYINLILAGILFAYMYLKSGNLWMCIGYHITWNYFQGYVYGFKVSGMKTYGILSTSYHSGNILNGGAFGPEGGLFVTAVMLAGLLFVWYYYRNHNYDFIASEEVPAVTINSN